MDSWLESMLTHYVNLNLQETHLFFDQFCNWQLYEQWSLLKGVHFL
jgi:hypothetical protein